MGGRAMTFIKEESKLSVRADILQPDLCPELYKGFCQKRRATYYPPGGEGG
jgi:hypothetical protein